MMNVKDDFVEVRKKSNITSISWQLQSFGILLILRLKILAGFLNKRSNLPLHTTTMLNDTDYTVVLDTMFSTCTTSV
jgi:hypothetical protein